MSLTEEEKKELEMLDNPEVEYFSSSTGGIFSNLFTGGGVKSRKEKVVNLRMKIRMEELGLDENKDWNKYYEIEKEEEERFDNRFKK